MDASLRPILITGHHRSGSTWVGHVLSQSPTIIEVPEVFNLHGGLLRGLWDHWYQYLEPDENLPSAAREIEKLLAFQYDFRHVLGGSHGLQWLLFATVTRLRTFWRFRRLRQEGAPLLRPLIKDPIALLAAEWLAAQFDMEVVILIRHPAAFVNSLLRVGWGFDFDELLRQDRLMDGYLHDLRDELEQRPADPIDRGALLWCCFATVIGEFKKAHPGWMLACHEDICRDPDGEFRRLCAALDIPWGSEIVAAIRESSSGSNPVSAPHDKTHYLKRNSRRLASSWKRSLTEAQIAHVRSRVEHMAKQFYDPESWD